jgi:hypothetical protein
MSLVDRQEAAKRDHLARKKRLWGTPSNVVPFSPSNDPPSGQASRPAVVPVNDETQRLKDEIHGLSTRVAVLEARLENFTKQAEHGWRAFDKHPAKEIATAVAKFYQIRLSEMMSRTRPPHVIRPRHVSYYLARQLSGRGLESIAYALHRDHTSVMHGIKKITAELETDTQLQADIAALLTILGENPNGE